MILYLGKPSRLTNTTSVDWVPSIDLENANSELEHSINHSLKESTAEAQAVPHISFGTFDDSGHVMETSNQHPGFDDLKTIGNNNIQKLGLERNKCIILIFS